MAKRRAQPKTADFVILSDDVDDPIELIEGEAALRYSLSRKTQLTADVVIDLEKRGALYHFVKDRRRAAIAALMALVEVDPNDAAAVYALQRQIHPYFDACDFVHRTIAEGDEADQTIEETYGNARHED
jgi:hypothetical protein